MSFKNEKIVETKTCQKCQVSFDITDKDLEFYDKVSPDFDNKRYSIPTPSFCPECRNQRRLSYRNERSLYKTKCHFTNQEIVSMFHPEAGLRAVEQKYWWGDSWDALDYGQDFDFSRSFFEQFHELYRDTPHPNLFITSVNENSEYINCAGEGAKNCYLIFNTGACEDCAYLHGSAGSTDCYDSNFSLRNSHCYETISCADSQKLFYSIDSHECRDSSYLRNCIGCSDCVGCVNLQNKQYYYLNQKLSREEFEQKKSQLNNPDNFAVFFKEYTKLVHDNPSISHHNLNSDNIIGDYLNNCSSCYHCFDLSNCEDCKFCSAIKFVSDSMDSYGYGFHSSLLYESLGSGGESQKVVANFYSESCTNSYYCVETKFCSDCFGCVGLKNKQYCIFNKQYTKQQYEQLVPKIIEKMRETGEWGEFFPSKFSPFGYNETVAQEYFPLNKKQAQQLGFNWSDYEAPFPKVEKIIPADKLPTNIIDIPDDILNWAVECEVTKKPFKIIPGELAFYRKHSLPIPNRHPNQRHLDRTALRNPRKLFQRDCDSCGIQMQTTYSPDRPEKVYCEECYNQEIY